MTNYFHQITELLSDQLIVKSMQSHLYHLARQSLSSTQLQDPASKTFILPPAFLAQTELENN